jgi:two-component system sensor histidine kinase KdpD
MSLALAAATIAVAILEHGLNLVDASSVYLLAVVLMAVFFGVGPAIGAALGGFVIYDFLFIEPRFTLTVDDPREWLNLILLLVVGIVVGRLAGESRDRAVAAECREREARALFRISRALALAPRAKDALPEVVASVSAETEASRVWVTVGDGPAARVVADTVPNQAAPIVPVVNSLARQPGDKPARWVRVHAAGSSARREATPARANGTEQVAYRVSVDAGAKVLGALWAIRRRDQGDPAREETRVLASAADQIGRALERDQLRDEAATVEIARRSDTLKSALLDSVSHDLRTPLASIRAAAGTLMDPDVEWPPERRREIAASIDHEADWLNRLVTNLLDMSRVDAGELRPNLAAFDLSDLVAVALGRSTVGTGGRDLEVDVAEDLPPVLVDEVLIGQVLANTLDNAAKYAGPAAPIRVSAAAVDDGVRLTVEDGGPGVPPEALPRLFEKFYRVPRKGEGSRRGTGIGLAVVRGIIDAMGGQVRARASVLGGLALDFDLRTAPPPSPAEDGP